MSKNIMAIVWIENRSEHCDVLLVTSLRPRTATYTVFSGYDDRMIGCHDEKY